MLPSRKQYNKWGLLAKYTFWSFILTLFGTIFSMYIGCWPKKNSPKQYSVLEHFADVELIKILEGSTLCCDIKTGVAVFFMPQEGEIRLKASDLIGIIPDSTGTSELSFSFTISQKDSTKIFDCKSVGKSEIDIYFFKNNKVFCSKPAIIDFRDPSAFCDLK